MTDQQKIKQLENENEELKELLREGKEVFTTLDDVLGISKAAESNMLFAKVGSIIMKVTSKPEMMQNVVNYLAKLNQASL